MAASSYETADGWEELRQTTQDWKQVMAQWGEKHKIKQRKAFAKPKTVLPEIPQVASRRGLYMTATKSSQRHKYKVPDPPSNNNNKPTVVQRVVSQTGLYMKPTKSSQIKRPPHRLETPVIDEAEIKRAKKVLRVKAARLRKRNAARRIQRQARVLIAKQKTIFIQKWFRNLRNSRAAIRIQFCYQRHQITQRIRHRRCSKAAKKIQQSWRTWICISRARIELFQRKVSRRKLRSFMIVRLKFWHQKETSAICIQYRYRQHKQRCNMNRMASFLSLWWKGIDFRLEIRDRKEKLKGIRQQISARKIQHAVVFKIQQQYRKRLSLELFRYWDRREDQKRRRAAIFIQNVAFSFIVRLRLYRYRQAHRREVATETIRTWICQQHVQKSKTWLTNSDVDSLLNAIRSMDSTTTDAIRRRALGLLHLSIKTKCFGSNEFVFWSAVGDFHRNFGRKSLDRVHIDQCWKAYDQLTSIAKKTDAKFLTKVFSAYLNASQYNKVISFDRVEIFDSQIKLLIATAYLKNKSFSKAALLFHELTEETNDYWIDSKEMHLITGFVYEKWAMTNTHLTSARDEMYQAAGLESIQHSVTWTSIAAKCDEHQVYALSSELWARAVECANGMSIDNYKSLGTARQRCSETELAAQAFKSAHELAPWNKLVEINLKSEFEMWFRQTFGLKLF